MSIAQLALDSEEEKRLKWILRPRTRTPRKESIEEEIKAIEGHIARLRQILDQEVTAESGSGDADAGSHQSD